MTPEIRELDERTREQIAAGEVIERPASAVKELVENAIDAAASRVDVDVEEGGIESITVADDGVGMDRSAVRAAVREHTTSKIGAIEDLTGGVGTLGFRGEALHAIGAVSRMSVTTAPRDGHAEATELVVEGGEVTDVSPAGRGPGTTVAVEDLFFNVPARRKYLKQPSTEFARVNTVVTAYALANPDVAVSLSHDGRETFATTGQGDRRAAVLAVYGRDVADAMIEVEAASGDGPAAAGPLSDVSGLVSHPETTRAGSEYCTVLVNGRYVRSSVVRDAVLDAYGAQLPPDRYPFAVLSVSVDPAAVDVNVHPRKLAVRFADDDAVREQVSAVVEAALLRDGLVRSSAPRGQSAPDQTVIDPGAGEEPALTDDEVAAGGEQPSDRASSGDREQAAGSADHPQSVRASQEGPGPTEASRRDAGPERALEASAHRETGGTDDSDGRGARVRGGHSQTRLDAETPVQEFDSLPAMRLLGQFRDTYVVAESADGLVLVDQHAADERVNYERLGATIGSGPAVQRLAAPETVELTAREAAAVRARPDVLAELGFQVEMTGDRILAVTGVPAAVAGVDTAPLVRDVCGALAEGPAAADATVAEAVDAVLADLACHPSVTGNTSLTEGSIRELLDALDDCENPYACPHGRPVVIELAESDLEARFERDYPGHGGRRPGE